MLTTEDPYFTSAYCEVNELVEGGVTESFRYEGPEGAVDHTFIVRPIPDAGAKRDLFDLITPYGYGGPRLRLGPGANPASLVAAFASEFAEFCRDRNVVSEFVRFHPFDSHPEIFASLYDIELLRTTVFTDLTGDKVIEREFSKSARKRIRRNVRHGIETRIIEAPESLDEFKRVYRVTMDRNEAADFYYFGDEYFDRLSKNMSEQIIVAEANFEEEIIASALCLVGAGRIHIHLSGTDSNFLRLSPAYNLRGAIVEWGVENQMVLVHHGGGRTNSPEDALYLYKKQFGSGSADFHVGRRIWNQVLYTEVSESIGIDSSQKDFFPAYRKRG